MAIDNPFVETSSNLTITMFGITVFSDTMIRFSTLKHFWKRFPHGQVKIAVSVTRDNTISNNRWHDYRILTYLMRALWVHATYLITDSVIKSCDSPDWLIQICYQSASSRIIETPFLNWPCGTRFKIQSLQKETFK